MGRASRYAPEVRERAVRMVVEHQGEQGAPVAGLVGAHRGAHATGRGHDTCGRRS